MLFFQKIGASITVVLFKNIKNIAFQLYLENTINFDCIENENTDSEIIKQNEHDKQGDK